MAVDKLKTLWGVNPSTIDSVMEAKNKEEFMKWLKAWHDEHLDVYEAFRQSVAGAHEGKMDFFEHNTKMLGINVQEVADEMQEEGRKVILPSLLVRDTEPHISEYAERIKEAVEKEDPHVLCMYYFMLFENGGIEIAQILGEKADDITPTPDSDMAYMYKKMMQSSVNNDIQKKSEWTAFTRGTVIGRIADWLKSALAVVKGKKGKRRSRRSLDELLIDDSEHLKSRIHHYLSRRHTDADIALILRALVLSGTIKPCKYAEFFSCLQDEYPEDGIRSIKRGQELFNALSQEKPDSADAPGYYDITEKQLSISMEKVRRMQADFSAESAK